MEHQWGGYVGEQIARVERAQQQRDVILGPARAVSAGTLRNRAPCGKHALVMCVDEPTQSLGKLLTARGGYGEGEGGRAGGSDTSAAPRR
jgi:hypothetical protein